MQRYVIYLGSFYPKANLVKFKGKVLRFVFGNRKGRDSESSTVTPIWVDGDFRPVKIRLINGETELLFRNGYRSKTAVGSCFCVNA